MSKTATNQRAIRVTCQGASTINLDQLTGIQGNLKTITRKKIEMLKARILKLGFNVPFHIWQHDGRNYILDGHQRTRVLLELQAQGYAIPPLPYDLIEADSLEDAKDKLLGISSQYGEFTIEGLREFTIGIDLDSDICLPSGEIKLESIRPADDDAADDDEPDAAPEITKAGELWSLGPHRLMIGDSTNRQHVDSLMRGDLAQLYFTDPPYGVDYTDEDRGGHNGGIRNDDLKDAELEQRLLAPAFKEAARHLLDDAAVYVWHASATRKSFERALTAAGFDERQYIIWAKPSIVMGRSQYQWAHEPCFYCGKTGITPRWTGDRKQSTMWTVTMRRDGAAYIALQGGVALSDGNDSQIFIQRDPPKGKKTRSFRVNEGEPVLVASLEGSDVWEIAPDSKKEYIHPNQKPVALSMRAMANNTNPGEIVLDSFTGSGSTLIGCQRAGRIFRGLELDPKWADRIIKRWCMWMFNHHLTPALLRNGEPYEWQAFCPEL